MDRIPAADPRATGRKALQMVLYESKEPRRSRIFSVPGLYVEGARTPSNLHGFEPLLRLIAAEHLYVIAGPDRRRSPSETLQDQLLVRELHRPGTPSAEPLAIHRNEEPDPRSPGPPSIELDHGCRFRARSRGGRAIPHGPETRARRKVALPSEGSTSTRSMRAICSHREFVTGLPIRFATSRDWATAAQGGSLATLVFSKTAIEIASATPKWRADP